MAAKQREKYVSKGSVGHPRRTPARGTEKILNKIRAWKAGKPVKLFVNNEWVDAVSIWGDPNRKLKEVDRD